ncbi:MAG: alpha/beta hydrolase family protein [Aristaeellaceae bacterium]
MKSMLHEGAQLSPASRTLWEVQAKAMNVPVEVASNLHTDIQRRMAEGLRRGDKRREAVRDGESLKRCQREARELFLSLIGGLPPAPEACSARVTQRCIHGGFILEKLLLQPRRDSWATANLYLPALGEPPYPAVLLTVGHDDRGKADPAYQYVAQLLAHQGIAALVLDPLGQGERFEHYEAELAFQPIQGCSGEHDLLDWKARLMGLTLARYFVQDGLCALDYLASRPEIDATRIGLTGHSGGGTQACMLMLAAGDRLACAAPCAYVTDAQAMVEAGVDPDNEMLWPGSLAQGLDYVDCLAGIAPRPLLLLSNRHDFFPREGTLRTLEAARQLWRRAGSDTLPDMVTAESGHAYPPSLARAAAEFFARHLCGRQDGGLREGFVFEELSPRETWCTPDGQLLRLMPGMRTIHDALREELDRCEVLRGTPDTDALVPYLHEALRLDALTPVPECRVYDEGICGHYQYRCILWRPQEGYWNCGVLLRDMRRGDGPLPTAIALWPEGTARLCEHSLWLHRAIRSGWQVLVMDVAASGALLPSRVGSTSMYVGWSTMYILNAYLMQLGDSLFATRTRQAVAAVRMLKDLPETDARRVCLRGEGEFSRYAELAGLVTGTAVSTDGMVQPYGEIVRERYHDQTHTHAWMLPGALRHFDTPDIRALLDKLGLSAADPAGAPL